MSILVFSDTHFTKKFDKKRFNKLSELINKADNVIIDGDFWEGLTISFDDFLNSGWNRLFSLLKAKKAVYIFGNHDDHRLSDDRIYKFCDKAVNTYELKTPKRTYFFTHGQDFLFPKTKDKNRNIKRSLKFKTKINIIIASTIQSILFTILGAKAFPQTFNEITIEQRKAIAPIEYLLVSGHTHRPQYKPEINFIDIGFFNYGWANYMLINENGDFEFKSERY